MQLNKTKPKKENEIEFYKWVNSYSKFESCKINEKVLGVLFAIVILLNI